MSHPPLTFFISGADFTWMKAANCLDVDPDLFFQDERAKRRGLPAEVPPEVAPLCGACDARIECLDWALENDEHGVWGGTTRQQREAIGRPIVRAKCPACQGRSLFRAGQQQVCGDCGSSWQATKIHGDAHAPVPGVSDAPVAPVIPLPVKWLWEQPDLFDIGPYRSTTPRPVRSCRRRRRRAALLEQATIPGIAPVVTLKRQVRTKPTAPLRAEAA